MAEHIVYVWLDPQKITITQQAEGDWLASGTHEGEVIETRRATENGARRMWVKLARRKDQPGPIHNLEREPD